MRFRIRSLDGVNEEFEAGTRDELVAQLAERFAAQRFPPECYLDVKTGRQWLSAHAHAYGLANYALSRIGDRARAWDHAVKTMAFYEDQVRLNRRFGMTNPEDFDHDFSQGPA